MCSDLDIKIAGDKPSQAMGGIPETQAEPALSEDEVKKARALGRSVAMSFIEDAKSAPAGEEVSEPEMLTQRRLLLSFTATVGFEQFCADDAVCGVAQKSFLDTLKEQDKSLYLSSSDTGAFSFYYLAYRRGSEVDRRIGQTFAMLCSHDGDPIYQELGEALYCWFLSTVKKAVKAQALD